jgi:hypothetical protein
MPKNKLISIGWLGVKRCYLNVPREEAIRRYARDEYDGNPGITDESLTKDRLIEEFEFDDEFHAYDVGGPY